MTSRARPIAEADWDAHREEITKLYCDQKWTQTRVAEFMSENRGFSATYVFYFWLCPSITSNSYIF